MLERRRSPRFVPESEVYARIKSSITVRIIDVSATGMQVESSSALPPAGQCDIWLPAEDGDVRMRVRVQRCRARFVQGDGASGGGLVYYAGIEFLEVDAAAQTALGNIVQRLAVDHERGPKPTRDSASSTVDGAGAGMSKAG